MLSLSPAENYAKLTDAVLVKRAVGGENAAFEQLMRRYNRRLYRAARSIVKNDTEAEDVLQDAYLQAFRSLSTFRGDSLFSTWITRIVVNEALARSRKTARRAEIIRLDCDMHPDSVEAPMEACEVQQPEHSAMRADTRRLLERKIDALPDAFRTVFMLRSLDEMSIEEISVVLDIPEATVRTRHFRARSMLREALAREIDFAIEEAFSFDGERCDRIVARAMEWIDAAATGVV